MRTSRLLEHATPLALTLPLLASAACAVDAAPAEPEGDRRAMTDEALTLPRAAAPSVDVSAESGQTVTSALAGWRTTAGTVTTEHLAGTNASSALIHFHWSPSIGAWRAENVTTLTGVACTGAVTAWQTPDGPYNVEHLAGRTPAGHLVVFYRSTRDNVWKTVDVTAKTGRSVAGDATSWQTPNGTLTVEHLAARDASGNLVVFWWSPAHDWQAIDVSARTGRRVASGVTSWKVQRGTTLYEYLAAASSTDGTLTIFSWTPATDWVSQTTSSVSWDGATPWLTGTVEHLAGAAADGTQFVLWRSGTGAWSRVDMTQITGERATGRPSAYAFDDGGEHVEFAAGKSPSGHPIVWWWKPSRDWQALDLTELTGHTITTRPETWLTPSGPSGPGQRTVEHLAARDELGHVRVFYSYDQPRTLADTVGASLATGEVVRHRNEVRKTLVILWDPHYPGVTKTPQADVAAGMFGAHGVAGYFRENSGGTFTLANAGVLGWYDADHPLDWYDGATKRDKAAAAMRAADADVNYASFDTNHDGRITPDELAIVFIHPGDHPGGLLRAGTGPRGIHDLDGSFPLKLDGVELRDCSEVSIGQPPGNFSVVAHEMSHLMINLPDMYEGFFTPTAPGMYSLMDSTYDFTHVDPANRLKLGWLQPRVVLRSGTYTVPDIETRRRVLVLMDPSRSTKEYVLVENRWKGASYEQAMRDQGLGVWHVMEESSAYDAAPPPSTVDLTGWNQVGGWGRRGVRMVRPIITSPFNDGNALWKAATGYDLVPNDPNTAHSSLTWGDGTSSRFALRHISAPSADMTVDIDIAAGGISGPIVIAEPRVPPNGQVP